MQAKSDKTTPMFSTITFDKWPVYEQFMTGVRRWKSKQKGVTVTEEYKEYWGLNNFREFAKQGFLPAAQLEALEGLYRVLGLKADQALVTPYTKNGDWLKTQVYAPVVQWDASKTQMVISINGGVKIPLEFAQGEFNGSPQIIAKAALYDANPSSLNIDFYWAPVNCTTRQFTYRDEAKKEHQVDRLELLVPVTADRRVRFAIPFHPGMDFRKSGNIAQSFLTGDWETFHHTCLNELSVAGKGGGQGGPMIDANRLIRGERWDIVKNFIAHSKGPLPIIASEWKLVDKVDFPAWAFRVGDSLKEIVSAFQWEDVVVEGWGKDASGQKNKYKLSEVEWMAVSASNDMVAGFGQMQSQPTMIRIKGPNRTNPDFIPQMDILPISSFEPAEQLEYFGCVYEGPKEVKALPPAEVQPVVEKQIIPVEATEIF